MTVTTFLLMLLGFLLGGLTGLGLYQWVLEKELKNAFKSIEDDLDFHSITLKDGKTLTISKSMLHNDRYVIAVESGANTSIIYVDANTLEVLEYGTDKF